MTEHEAKIRRAVLAFEKMGHRATLVENTDRYTIIDWRKGTGGSDYYVNYIIDKKRGSLIISGDLGDCIATWYNRNTVHNIAGYVRDIGYFIEKFQCSSDCYIYDDEEIIKDIQRELIEAGAEYSDEDWEEFKEDVFEYTTDNGFIPHGHARDSLDTHLGEDWWDGSSEWGRSVSQRVYLWAAGLNMAVDQLTEFCLLTEED